MATTITTANIKARLMIPAGTTTWDTDFALVATQVGAGVDGAAATAPAALLVEAAIMIAAGECWLGLCNRPGFAEAVSAAGVSMSALTKEGAVDMIKLGWSFLAGYMGPEAAALAAEYAARVLLAQARDDDASAQADAELLKLQNDAGRVGSEGDRLDAETALLSVQAVTEAEKAAKVVADAGLADAYAAQATAVAALKVADKARMDAVDAAILTDVPQEAHDYDGVFAVDSTEYDH